MCPLHALHLSNICSGPPEKKMGIKASNTAEVDTHYVSLSSLLLLGAF